MMSKSMNTLALFTSEGVTDIGAKGGSSAWKGNPIRMGEMTYLVLYQNRRHKWGCGTHRHGSRFLIGRITGVEELDDDPGRCLIKIDLNQIALCDVPGRWPGNQNPIMYTTLGDLGVDVEKLVWCSLTRRPNQPQSIIDDAKRRIAKDLNIEPSHVQVTISL